MTKTQNYQLPQWEARDPIRRGDFNQAMSAIDAGIAAAQAAAEGAQETADGAYSADYPAVECYTTTVTNFSVGDTVCTFSFAPRFIIMQGTYASAVLRQGTSSELIDYYTYSIDHRSTFRLSGTSLSLTSRGSEEAVTSLTILAFR